MNIKARRVLVLLLSFLFLGFSPYLIFYGLGYKYNFQKNRLEKTGVFFIKSFPRGAQIYLDGKKQKKETPTQITRLLAKVYEVKIAKDGYREWRKNLPLEPQLTTFIEDVSLFYDQLKMEKILSGSFADLLLSHDQQFLALTEASPAGQTIWLYEPASDSLTKVYETAKLSGLKLLEWSFSDKKLLVKDNSNYLVINAETPGVYFNLQRLSPSLFKEVKFSDSNDNLLYGLGAGKLELLNLLEEKAWVAESGQILSYLPFNNQLALIKKENSEYYLKIRQNETSAILFSLPYSPDYRFLKVAADRLILFDQKQRQLYLIDPADFSQPLKTVLANVDDFQWHDRQILYWNQSELWVYYPESDEKILLERNSQGVKNGFWHPNAAYVYGAVSGELKLYELDSRDQRNVYGLLPILPGQEKLMATNKKGDYLYLITSFQEVAGFYKVKIQ